MAEARLLQSPTLHLSHTASNDLGPGNGTKEAAEVIGEDEGDKICYDKMSIIEETQYDDLETCNHSYQKEYKL